MKKLLLVGLLVPCAAFALTPVETSASFLGNVDLSVVVKVVLSVGAGLAGLAVLSLACLRGYMLLTGKVVVRGHGLWDKDVYESAMRDLQNHWEKRGIMDKESREELSRWQLRNPDKW